MLQQNPRISRYLLFAEPNSGWVSRFGWGKEPVSLHTMFLHKHVTKEERLSRMHLIMLGFCSKGNTNYLIRGLVTSQ